MVLGISYTLERGTAERIAMSSVKVFGLPTSTDVARVLACLFEKDVEFQLIRTDSYKGDHKVPEFLRLQDPSGQVTFKDDNTTLLNSREICRYVAEKYANQGTRGLLGAGALERSSVEQWLQAEVESFEPPSSDLVFHLGFALQMGMKPDRAVVDRSEKKLAEVLDIYERRLAVSEYLAGDEFTLADLSHLPNSHYLATRSGRRGREMFGSRESLDRWWRSVSTRPSWERVVELQGEHPAALLDHDDDDSI